MTPAANALVTLAEAKTFLEVTDDADDMPISRAIDAASQFIEEWCQTALIIRAFTENLEGYRKRLYLKRYPVVTVTSITDPAAHTVPAADYVIKKEYGILEHFGRFPQAVTSAGQPTLWAVVYTAGRYATVVDVAEDVKLACMQLTEIFREGDVAVTSVGVGGLSVSYAQGSAAGSWMAPQVKALLSPYRANLVM